MRIILITGISGSGKSVALNALEDAGYYCIDNLPPRFLPELSDFLHEHARLAVAIDARTSGSLTELPSIIDTLRHHHTVDVLFLNASTQALIQRFSETRRRHPLSASALQDPSVPGKDLSLADAIERERELLAGLAALGQQIDTSALHIHTLRAWVNQWVAHERTGLALMFESFAFKWGVPLDADFVFDARVLPNPYYDAALRGFTGLDAPVADFLGAAPEAHALIEDIETFLRKWLPRFQEDNRSYLTIAIGCTGGQHRSVYLAEVLGACLASEHHVLVRHREIKA